MRKLSLVMSECSLSGRGQGHVSNFYIVKLENFATASRRYTGDIHNSTVVGLFMTHCLQLMLQLHTIGLVRTCRISSLVSALLRGNWQDYYWQDASRGHSAIAELLVQSTIYSSWKTESFVCRLSDFLTVATCQRNCQSASTCTCPIYRAIVPWKQKDARGTLFADSHFDRVDQGLF